MLVTFWSQSHFLDSGHIQYVIQIWCDILNHISNPKTVDLKLWTHFQWKTNFVHFWFKEWWIGRRQLEMELSKKEWAWTLKLCLSVMSSWSSSIHLAWSKLLLSWKVKKAWPWKAPLTCCSCLPPTGTLNGCDLCTIRFSFKNCNTLLWFLND